MAVPEIRRDGNPHNLRRIEHLHPTGKFISVRNERAIQLHEALDTAFSRVFPDDANNTSLIALKQALGDYQFPIHMSRSESARTHQGTKLQVTPLGIIRAVETIAQESEPEAYRLVAKVKTILEEETRAQAVDIHNMLHAYQDFLDHGENVPTDERVERMVTFGNTCDDYLTSLQSTWQLYADAQNIPGPVGSLVPDNFTVTDRIYLDTLASQLRKLHARGIQNEFQETQPLKTVTRDTPILGAQDTDSFRKLLNDAEFWKMLGEK